MSTFIVKPTFDFGYVKTDQSLVIHFGLCHALVGESFSSDEVIHALLINPITTLIFCVMKRHAVIAVEVFDFIFGETRNHFFPQSDWFEKQTCVHQHPYRMRYGIFLRARAWVAPLFRPFFSERYIQIEVEETDLYEAESILIPNDYSIDDVVDDWYVG